MNKELLLLLCLLLSPCFSLPEQESNCVDDLLETEPAFQVDYPFPTADKPQSKLWFAEGCWWALLPCSSGPCLWQRTREGWKEHTYIREALSGIPGRSDVWADENEVTAVGVGPHSLAVFRLIKRDNTMPSGIFWEPHKLGVLFPPDKNGIIETATVVKDGMNTWWVAATANTSVYVWASSSGGEKWTSSIRLADGISKDDICTITLIPGGIAVIWSDQVRDEVATRVHTDGYPIDKWKEKEVIEAGNKTADDHLNAALSVDGTLWLAAKNSLDKLGKPQLVLRVRLKTGQWRNFPYANLGSVRKPSRPIIIATEDPSVVLAGHTIYNAENPALGEIVFGKIDTTHSLIPENFKHVISPAGEGAAKEARINDVTGPKTLFPSNAPWIVLASDKEGRIYEADLKIRLPRDPVTGLLNDRLGKCCCAQDEREKEQ